MAISSAVSASAVARVLGIETIFKDLRGGSTVYLPQRVAVIGQGTSDSVYSTEKEQVTSALEAAQTYGFGSPIHLAMLQLMPTNGDGVGTIPVTIYPLEDDDQGVAAVGDITPSGAQTEAASYTVVVNNIESSQFVISVGDTVADICTAITAAINGTLEMPVTATDEATSVTLTAKWAGASSNGIIVSIDGSTDAGTTFALTQPTGGLVNPDVQSALDQFGDVWETMVLNCLDIADTTAIAAYSTFGEGRWGALTRKPLIVFTGTTESDVDTAILLPESRKTDRTNSQLVSPASDDLPFVVAAGQLSRIVTVANDNPARDYGSQQASYLTPGADGDQWTSIDREQAVQGGSSTVQVKDGVVNVSDTVTFYHPTGDATPAYRYVCDIVKLQNALFNFDLEFATEEWDGAPLIPDDQATTNRSAKKPKTAVAAACAIIDGLGLEAIISDPETAKANTFAEIDSSNPKRLNLSTTIQLSGNTNIISVDLNFGFYFGTSTTV